MLTKQHRQESLSRSFVQALSALAGIDPGLGDGYDYGVDGQFRVIASRDGRYFKTGTALDYQLKASANWFYRGDKVIYDLDINNYNDLISRNTGIGLVLILLCLPKHEKDWLFHCDKFMVLRHCCYWYRIQGPLIHNRSKKRIYIPIDNKLTVSAVKELMADAYRREIA